LGLHHGALCPAANLIDEEAAVAGFARKIAAETDPAELIRLTVPQNRSLHEHGGDIIAAVRSGAAVDATLAGVYAEGTRRHDDRMRWVISKLQAGGALRPSLAVAQAIGLLSALCSNEALADLTTRHGWALDQCERPGPPARCPSYCSPQPQRPVRPAPVSSRVDRPPNP
jgi:hypothetical protein